MTKPNITKIVLTGGPCGGKSTAIEKIDEYFTKRGYKVISVPETATELISNGITPLNCENPFEFQKILMTLQMEKEHLFEKAASNMNYEKIIMLYDRGVLDNKGYVNNDEFNKLMRLFNTTIISQRDKYDAVFNLTTAAKGKKDCYTLENNKARKDSINDAIKLDDKMIAAWTGHPHFRIIDNSTDFDEKIKRLIKEIAFFLGEPEPLEIEKKYLIEYPDINLLEQMSNCTKVEIYQTYLESINGSERRIRARGVDGDYIYFLTEKKKLNGLKRVEVEKRLTQKEYFTLLMQADPTRKTIKKTRYCLTINNQYFEIDIYPQWQNKAIMEIELSDENEVVKTPDFINIINEVTFDDAYKNYNIALDTPSLDNFVRTRK